MSRRTQPCSSPTGGRSSTSRSQREEIVCLSGDLTRQCEVDLFQDEIPERFINAGMAEANMMSMAGGWPGGGHIPFVHTFGVFATRRPLDQIVNSVAYPNLPVRIVGFMPGVSSPGGPSHQAIEDVALMRALPNMTVIDVADAVEIRQAVGLMVDLPGPAYLRLKRGEIPVMFADDHELSLTTAQILTPGDDVALVASGMMVSTALRGGGHAGRRRRQRRRRQRAGDQAAGPRHDHRGRSSARAVVTAENHSVIGGLGSAVAEVLAEAGLARPLRRVGLQDTFAEGAQSAASLFLKYGLGTQAIVDQAWSVLARPGAAPQATPSTLRQGPTPGMSGPSLARR